MISNGNIVVSLAKAYSNRVVITGIKRIQRNAGYLYYIDEGGNFRTRRINALEALYYRGKKVHRYKIECPECYACKAWTILLPLCNSDFRKQVFRIHYFLLDNF